MSEMLIVLLQMVAEDLQFRGLSAVDHEKAARVPILGPMLKGNYERPGLSCLLGESMKDAMVEVDGWEFVDERTVGNTTEIKPYPRWGWVATRVGSKAVMQVDSRSQVAIMEDDTGTARKNKTRTNDIVISHLKSYEHMGRFRVECNETCKCDPLEVEGHWTHDVSLYWLFSFQVTEHANCLVTFTVIEGTSSGEHKAKINGWMLAEQGTESAYGEVADYLGRELEISRKEAQEKGAKLG